MSKNSLIENVQDSLVTDALDIKLTHEDYLTVFLAAEDIVGKIDKCPITTKLAMCIIVVQSRKSDYFLAVSRLLTPWAWIGGHFLAMNRELLRHYLFFEILKAWKEGVGPLRGFLENAAHHVNRIIAEERAQPHSTNISPVYDALQQYFNQFFQNASNSSDIARFLHETISNQFPIHKFSSSFSTWARAILINEQAAPSPKPANVTVHQGDHVIIGTQVSLLTPGGHRLISNAKVANQNTDNTYSVCWFDEDKKQVQVEGQVDIKRIITEPVVIAPNKDSGSVTPIREEVKSPVLIDLKRKHDDDDVEQEEEEELKVASPPLSSRTRSRQVVTPPPSNSAPNAFKRSRRNDDDDDKSQHDDGSDDDEEDNLDTFTPLSTRSAPILTPVRTIQKVASSCPPGPLPAVPARNSSTLTFLYNAVFRVWGK